MKLDELSVVLRLCGFSADVPSTDLLHRCLEKITEMGDQFSLKDFSEIKGGIIEQYKLNENPGNR